MKPMALVAWGLAIVVVDFRINQLDVINDLVGWWMCLVGLMRVHARSEWFGLAIAGSVAGLIALLGEGPADGAAPLVFVIALAGFAVTIWFAAFTCGVRDAVDPEPRPAVA